jgi:hypothetical protein
MLLSALLDEWGRPVTICRFDKNSEYYRGALVTFDVERHVQDEAGGCWKRKKQRRHLSTVLQRGKLCTRGMEAFMVQTA